MSTNGIPHFESASASFRQLAEQLQREEAKVLQAQAVVDQRAELLDQQAEALAQEKQRMSAAGIANNDVLDLNVGGVFFSVKRATLTQVEGSHLASMFSGRWEDCLDRDSTGRVFLAFDPYSFQQILTMLRCRLFDIANSAAPYKAIITPDKLHAYKCLVDYLGLEGGWKMPFFSSPGLADVMQQQFFTFQMIVEPNGRSTVLPVTDADKELFVDKW
ncbi:hypothetical protein WJX82_000147 [Trebouxia sp. C0006]